MDELAQRRDGELRVGRAPRWKCDSAHIRPRARQPHRHRVGVSDHYVILGPSHDIEHRAFERVVPTDYANLPACCRRRNAGVMLSL